MQATTERKFIKDPKAYLDRLGTDTDVLIIPRDAEDDGGIVLMTIDEYNFLTETAYFSGSPANREKLRQGIAQMERGEVVEMSVEDVDKLTANG